MNIRLFNGKILPMTGEEIFQGEVWVEGNQIIFVGSKEDAAKRQTRRSAGLKGEEHNQQPADQRGRDIFTPAPAWDREIDCRGNLLMPGFKNAHTHSPMTFLRSYADDMPLQEWLNQQIFPMEAKLSEEDMYHLTKLAIMEYVTSGITSNFDMYLLTEPRVKAALDCGFRTVICGSVNDFTGSVEQMEKEYSMYLSANRSVCQSAGGAASDMQKSLVSYQLGFHAEYTTKRELIEQIAEAAGRHGAPVYMHLSETRQEVEACRQRYGMSPVEFLDACGIFQHGGGGFHCVHVSDHDIDILKERNVFVISNPASNMKLASGIAPIERMDQAGIPIAIGTDGPASNNCLDMFREMFLVTGLQKLHTQNAAALSADKVLHMAVTNGARAMGLMDCDSIAVGKKADLILIDLHRPNMQPENNLVKNLVYSGSKDNVKLTMINGKILYEEHQFYIGTDPEEVYRKANEIITRIKYA